MDWNPEWWTHRKIHLKDFNNSAEYLLSLKRTKNHFSFECRKQFYFTSVCDWSSQSASLSQPIRRKTETNHDLVVHVLSFLRGSDNFTLSFHWLLQVFSFLMNDLCDNFTWVFIGSYRYFPFLRLIFVITLILNLWHGMELWKRK